MITTLGRADILNERKKISPEEQSMYAKIFVALDGSTCSDFAKEAAIALAEKSHKAELVGCHSYTARLHAIRFNEMEPGLPEKYQEPNRLLRLRDTHEEIIGTGMKLISDAFLDPLNQLAQTKHLLLKNITVEGRNYIELLKVIHDQKPGVVVLGAWGHGHVPEDTLGSVTERILLYGNTSDLLILRCAWNLRNRPIVVGVDGSNESYEALARAIEIGKEFNSKVIAVAVYDPYFHTGVFQTITNALPPEAKKKFNFTAQEELHDEIINSGLEHIYNEGLERGKLLAQSMGSEIETQVLSGKVYPQLHHFAVLHNAGLLVVGRYGLHAEPQSLLGSNTHNLARLSKTNLLIVSKTNSSLKIPKLPKIENIMEWTPEAKMMLDRVPPFVKGVAQRAIENHAREKGLSCVTEDIVRDTMKRFGMDSKERT